MKVVAIMQGTRSERRAYAAALGGLARRGHEVTVAVQKGVRAFEEDVRPARLVPVEAAKSEPPLPPNPGPREPIVGDFAWRFPFARTAHDLAIACSAEALLLDVAGGIAAVGACARGGVRKVALRLDSWHDLAAVREPNVGFEDDVRGLADAALSEFAERQCASSIVPFAAQAGRVAAPAKPVVLSPAVPETWLDGAPSMLFSRAGRPLIAAVGPWLPATGFDVLVRAFREIRRVHPEAALVSAGETSIAFPARREFRWVALDRLAGDARPAIQLVDDGDVTLRALFSMADVLLHPTAVPLSGTAIVEALVSGVPVVASDLPAYREWLEPGRTAHLVPVDDPVALAAAALEILADRDRAKRMVAAGREVARARFAPERLVDGLERLLAAGG